MVAAVHDRGHVDGLERRVEQIAEVLSRDQVGGQLPRGEPPPEEPGVDPGHGGEDPGAVGRGGTYEKNVTLAIGRRLREMIVSLTLPPGETLSQTQSAVVLENLIGSFLTNRASDAGSPGSAASGAAK